MSSLPNNFLDGIATDNILPERRRRPQKYHHTQPSEVSDEVSLPPIPSTCKPKTPISQPPAHLTITSPQKYTTTPSAPPPKVLPKPHTQPQSSALENANITSIIEKQLSSALEKIAVVNDAVRQEQRQQQQQLQQMQEQILQQMQLQQQLQNQTRLPSHNQQSQPLNQPFQQCMSSQQPGLFDNQTNFTPNFSQPSFQTPLLAITKYSGLINVDQFIEDLNARFILQPHYHATDRQKIMVAVESLEGSSIDGSSEAPKEWARLELHLFPELRDNWLAFAQKLRQRYLNPALRQLRVQERQNLKQGTKSVQEYKQRFEYLCKETYYTPQVWAEEFFKGLADPILNKLAGVAFIDYTNYEMISQLAIQFDTSYRIRQELRLANNSGPGAPFKIPPQNKPVTHPSFSNSSPNSQSLSPPSTEIKGKISQEIRDYRRNNNLCMFDGGNHPTYLCQRLIEKLAKEGKPPPAPPSPSTYKS